MKLINKDKDTLIYKSGNTYVRSTKHKYIDYTNKCKIDFLDRFIEEYRRVINMLLFELWDMKYIKNQHEFYLKHGYIKNGLPPYLNVSDFNCLKNYNGFLSGRMLSQILKDLMGIIRGLYKSAKSNKDRIKKKKDSNGVEILNLTRPNLSNINPEIAPKHINIIENPNGNSIMDYYIKFVNLTNTKNENTIVPIILTPMDLKFINNDFDTKGSIFLTKRDIILRYEKTPIPPSTKGKTTVGGDIGMNKILTISNGEDVVQTTPKKDSQEKDLVTLMDKAKRKKKGSKAYKRTTREIEVFTQEVMNKLDFSLIHTLRLESNKGLKKNTGNANHNWKTQTITDKVLRMCQDNQVDYLAVPAAYKSQRCFPCHFVHRNNRKGEKFKCLNCGHINDADVISASNSSFNLPQNNLWSFAKQNRDSGFFWGVDGLKTGSHVSPDKK